MAITIRKKKKREQDMRRKPKEKEVKTMSTEPQLKDYNLPDLPRDLVLYNILSKLSANSLGRFRCVCKLWNDTIDHDPHFTSTKLQEIQSNPILMFNFFNINAHIKCGSRSFMDNHCFYLKTKEDAVMSETKNGGVELRSLASFSEYAPKSGSYNAWVGCSNGLVCLCVVSDDSCLIRIFNPSMRQVLKTIPPIDVDFESIKGYGFGYDSLTKKYKVVCIVVKELEYCCMVYTLGSSQSWIKVTFSENCEVRSNYKPAISCDGALYWPTSRAFKMLSFDLNDEKFQVIDITREWYYIPLDHHNENVKFAEVLDEGVSFRARRLLWFHYLEYKECLCLATLEEFDGQHCRVNLFILNNKIKQEWVKKTHLVPYPCDNSTRIMCFYDQVLLYWFCGERFLLYNLDTKVSNLVKLPSNYISKKYLDALCNCDDDDYKLYSYVANPLCLNNLCSEGIHY